MTEQILAALEFALAIDGKEIKSRSPAATGKAASPAQAEKGQGKNNT